MWHFVYQADGRFILCALCAVEIACLRALSDFFCVNCVVVARVTSVVINDEHARDVHVHREREKREFTDDLT